MLISDRVWSDFGGHLPLVRSFSLGRNWPPQNPLFPGEPIKYHFGFYVLAGLMERTGLRIDWAVNLPSILGFSLMLVMIYVLSVKLFSRPAVGIIAVLLLLFNGSLAFLKFFQLYPPSTHSLTDIYTNRDYSTFGPWDGNPIVAIWNLNIFINQRHLAPAIGLGLLIIYLVWFKPVRPLYLSLILATLLFINQAIFVGIAVFLLWRFIISPSQRKYLITIALFFLPFIYLSFRLIHISYLPKIHFGFFTKDPVNFYNLLVYWFHNLGLHLLLIPTAIILAPKPARLFALPMAIIFLIPNLWQLSPDIFNNHKFLNLFIVWGVIFTASLLVKLWQNKWLRPPVLALFVFLTLSGVIDNFTTFNDSRLTLADQTQNPDIKFIVDNIPPQTIVLNSRWFYHPASLAGRPVFNGYSYFTWSHGYDNSTREQITKDIYQAQSKTTACSLLTRNHIGIVELRPDPEDFLKPNFSLFKSNFTKLYQNPLTGLTYYDVPSSCTQ